MTEPIALHKICAKCLKPILPGQHYHPVLTPEKEVLVHATCLSDKKGE